MTTKTTMRRSLLFALLLLAPAAQGLALSTARADGRATVRHVPPAEADGNQPLRLVAEVVDAWTENRLVARYRSTADEPTGPIAKFDEIPFERSSAGGYYATIPAGDVHRPGLEYYIVGVMSDGSEVTHFASAQAPHTVRVEPATELRWIEAEKERLHGRMARVRARMEAVRFGPTDGTDLFFRGEIDWTSRLITRLYSFTLGYGFVQGTTPEARDADNNDPSVSHAARYGFAEVRLRMRSNVWFDGGVSMGFSHDGFSTGVRGQIVLGKEWRTCVQIGGLWMQDLDSEIFLRLQWDTVWPFYMGAKVSLTHFPGSIVGGGSIITYDITLPVTSRFSATAQASYAARGERPGAFGAGLATSFEF
jgi:hypothetical protein